MPTIQVCQSCQLHDHGPTLCRLAQRQLERLGSSSTSANMQAVYLDPHKMAAYHSLCIMHHNCIQALHFVLRLALTSGLRACVCRVLRCCQMSSMRTTSTTSTSGYDNSCSTWPHRPCQAAASTSSRPACGSTAVVLRCRRPSCRPCCRGGVLSGPGCSSCCGASLLGCRTCRKWWRTGSSRSDNTAHAVRIHHVTVVTLQLMSNDPD